jgi:uncharacterized membrane protein HdeD (DUF308 family)
MQGYQASDKPAAAPPIAAVAVARADSIFARMNDDLLARNSWAVGIRGWLAIGFGLLTLFRPGISLTFLLILFGVYALDDGIFALISAVQAGRREERWWPIALEGVLGIAVGLYAFINPSATAFALFLLIAFWAIFTGFLELFAAPRLRRVTGGGTWLFAVGGLLRIALGIILLARPVTGVALLIWMIGFYALIYGVVMLAFSLRLKRHWREHHPPVTGGTEPLPV